MISPAHRRRLNRAMHELRRPLQALALLGDGASPESARKGLLEQSSAALSDLEHLINGESVERPRREVSCRELVLAALERWRPAVREPDAIRVYWDAGPAVVNGDPIGMARAFDNLISNAIEHGSPPLVLTAARVAGRLRITVANGAPGENEDRSAGADPRRGHGVSIVSDLASSHHGRFALCRTGSGCVAALELPLVDAGLARAA
jgi:signal transduction histidine kinase